MTKGNIAHLRKWKTKDIVTGIVSSSRDQLDNILDNSVHRRIDTYTEKFGPALRLNNLLFDNSSDGEELISFPGNEFRPWAQCGTCLVWIVKAWQNGPSMLADIIHLI